MTDRSTRKRLYPRGAWLWVPALVFIMVGALALWQVPQWLLQHWIPSSAPEEQRKLLGSAAQIVLLALGGVIAVIGVALSIARHGQDLVASERSHQELEFEREKERTRRAESSAEHSREIERETRRADDLQYERRVDEERELRARFVTAVGLLSAEAPVQRSAGLYALAALGSDWTKFGRRDELQVCVDVICGYLRSAPPDRDGGADAEADVRRVGYDLIRGSLRPDEAHGDVPWSGLTLDLSRATIWFDVDLTFLMCEGRTSVILDNCAVSDGARLDLGHARVGRSSKLTLAGARLLDGGSITLSSSIIQDGGALDASDIRVGAGCALTMDGIVIRTSAAMSLVQLRIAEDADVSIKGLEVKSKGKLRAQYIKIRGGSVLSMESAEIREEGQIWLDNASVVDKSILDLGGVAVIGGVLGLTNITVADASIVRLDNADLAQRRSVSFEGARLLRDGHVTVSFATLDDQALVLPNGQPALTLST